MFDPDEKIGEATLRVRPISSGFRGIVIVKGTITATEDGSDKDDVWARIRAAAKRANPNYFGFDGAINRFLKFFPDGFRSDGYRRAERDYKDKARAKLLAGLPLSSVEKGKDMGRNAATAFQATNLLSVFEKAKLIDALRSPSADAFVRGAARFANGDTAPGLAEMSKALRPFESAKWTVVTYLPFFWRPEAHMFLKPEVTKDFAERVGHGFAEDYSTDLNPRVYASLLDLVVTTEKNIADLQPKDRIDVQSFIWTVGAYKETDEQTKA